MYGPSLQYVTLQGFVEAKNRKMLLPLTKETDDVAARKRGGPGHKQSSDWIDFVYGYVMASDQLVQAAKDQLRDKAPRIRNFYNRQKAKWNAYKKIFQRSG